MLRTPRPPCPAQRTRKRSNVTGNASTCSTISSTRGNSAVRGSSPKKIFCNLCLKPSSRSMGVLLGTTVVAVRNARTHINTHAHQHTHTHQKDELFSLPTAQYRPPTLHALAMVSLGFLAGFGRLVGGDGFTLAGLCWRLWRRGDRRRLRDVVLSKTEMISCSSPQASHPPPPTTHMPMPMNPTVMCGCSSTGRIVISRRYGAKMSGVLASSIASRSFLLIPFVSAFSVYGLRRLGSI